MIRSKHITTVVAASSLAAALPASTQAHHILGHSTLSAVQEDIKAASEEARRQISSAQKAIENTGSHTRQHVVETGQQVVETVDSEVRNAARTASRVRWSAQTKVQDVRESAEKRAKPVVSYGQARVQQTSAAGQKRAERAVAGGRNRVAHMQGVAERRAERTKATAEKLSASAQRRLDALTYRITREVEGLMENGSVSVSTSAGEYSFGWTRSGGCWTGRLSTPLTPPASRIKRRMGASVEPVQGQRTGAETSQGDVSASTGC